MLQPPVHAAHQLIPRVHVWERAFSPGSLIVATLLFICAREDFIFCTSALMASIPCLCISILFRWRSPRPPGFGCWRARGSFCMRKSTLGPYRRGQGEHQGKQWAPELLRTTPFPKFRLISIVRDSQNRSCEKNAKSRCVRLSSQTRSVLFELKNVVPILSRQRQ